MKIAHIKKNLQEKHHLKISSIRSEDDLSYKNTKKVTNYAARWRSICKYFITPEIKRPEKTTRNNNSIKKLPVYTLKEDLNLQEEPSQKYQNFTLT